jgi:hypothetical protein
MRHFVIFLGVLGLMTVSYDLGQKSGLAYAVKSNNVPEDLEMACLRLWVGEQNKKWYEKHGK